MKTSGAAEHIVARFVDSVQHAVLPVALFQQELSDLAMRSVEQQCLEDEWVLFGSPMEDLLVLVLQ